MTNQQWDNLLNVIKGDTTKPPVGFIIDSPWLPNWYGITISEYFADQNKWLEANFKAINEFPQVMLLPGFWSEYGMCTEPSAFGARCTFPDNEFPHAHKVIQSVDDIKNLPLPNPKTDGLLPFVLYRLKWAENKIKKAGHEIRFAVARGPLNIASYLMGTTEFLMAMMMQPEEITSLIEKITSFLQNWIELQRSTFPSIDGILLLDDIIGFIGEEQFKIFALPFFQKLYAADVSVKFLHNDAACKVSAPYLEQMGVNLYNMGIDISLSDLKKLTQNKVTLLGNIPPRDILAKGGPEDVRKAVHDLLKTLNDKSRIVLSCGGGMPPTVSSDNIRAFLKAAGA
ncbi:uroporphyrinogen decarboxylase [candidate division KSB1 bacterium]|nr:uroporphyrinogen decarboxylase [candidate division KSB1 bacterium]